MQYKRKQLSINSVSGKGRWNSSHTGPGSLPTRSSSTVPRCGNWCVIVTVANALNATATHPLVRFVDAIRAIAGNISSK